MRLTWRDGVTTLLVIVVGLVYWAYATGTDLVIIGDTRGALALIGIAGLGMCITGGSSGYVGRNLYSGFMSILGIAALVLFVIGLITAESWTVAWLAIVIAVMWGAALVLRVFGTPITHQPSGA